MLNNRYRYDKNPILKLSSLQLKYKKIVEDKVNIKEYQFEKVKCIICGGNKFELLSEKDRYGLYMAVVICRTCGLIQTNPRMTQDSFNRFYDSDYRKLYSGTDKPTEDFFNDQVMHGNAIYDFITKVIKKPVKGQFIVEIGCGAGGILQSFKIKGNDSAGLDLGTEYINFGKKKGLDLMVGTINTLAKIKRKPDIVIYSHVLEHTLNPVNELNLLKKHLKPTSLVYIEVPGIKSILSSYDQDFLKYLQNAHTYHFTLTSLVNVANKAGFGLVYGNEGINAVFKLTKRKKDYVDDYFCTIELLKKLEKERRNPISLYKTKNKAFSLLLFLAKITKTKESARKIYHWYKYRHL